MATKKKKPQNALLGEDTFLVVSASKRTGQVVSREVEYCPRCQGGGCDFCNGVGKSDSFFRSDATPAKTHKSIRAEFRKASVERMVETFNKSQTAKP